MNKQSRHYLEYVKGIHRLYELIQQGKSVFPDNEEYNKIVDRLDTLYSSLLPNECIKIVEIQRMHYTKMLGE